MKVQLKRQDHGFTIIEVLIVLAIAGLILAIVFFAVPQLQRNQRDNQRQSLTTRLKAELETYASNSQGTYPFTGVAAANTVCTFQAAPAAQSCNDWYSRYICTASPCTNAAMKVNISDPTNTVATISYLNSTTRQVPAPWTAGNVYIHVGSKCNGDNLQASGPQPGGANSKQYAVLTTLDRDNTYYCVDNG